jgi:hypothetical protein
LTFIKKYDILYIEGREGKPTKPKGNKEMTVKEIARATNKITGATMYLCERYDGTLCLMIDGINVKNGERAREIFNRLSK